jgi:hypothetical protein
MPAELVDAAQETLIWLAEAVVAAGLPGIEGAVLGAGPELPPPQLAASTDAQSNIAYEVLRCMPHGSGSKIFGRSLRRR